MGNEEGNEMNFVPQKTVFENTLEAGSQMHTLLPLFESVGEGGGMEGPRTDKAGGHNHESF